MEMTLVKSFNNIVLLVKIKRTLFLCARFIATCSDKTEMIIWDLKGEVLAKVGEFLFSSYF